MPVRRVLRTGRLNASLLLRLQGRLRLLARDLRTPLCKRRGSLSTRGLRTNPLRRHARGGPVPWAAAPLLPGRLRLQPGVQQQPPSSLARAVPRDGRLCKRPKLWRRSRMFPVAKDTEAALSAAAEPPGNRSGFQLLELPRSIVYGSRNAPVRARVPFARDPVLTTQCVRCPRLIGDRRRHHRSEGHQSLPSPAPPAPPVQQSHQRHQ